jgi:hypothetical protein
MRCEGLEHEQRSVVRRDRITQQILRRCELPRRPKLVLDDLGGHLSPELAPAPRGKQLQAVGTQIAQAARAVDDGVHAVPQRRLVRGGEAELVDVGCRAGGH